MAEVFGTAWTEVAKDGVVAIVTELITDMAADDPKISYVYDRHDKAKLLLNAASIELDFVEAEDSYTDHNVKYVMSFSVRVHTAYLDGARDTNKNRRLLNSITNKLELNIKNIDPLYRIEKVHQMITLEDFYFTIGGTVQVDVSTTITHKPQE